MTCPRKVILAPAAEEEIAAILVWSADAFADATSRRDAALIVQGTLDLAKYPTRVGVHERPRVSVRLCC
jgi:plasmid stabilization system protein ParE